MTEAIDRASHAAEACHRHGTLTAEFLSLHRLAGFLILDDQIEPGRSAALRALELSRAIGNVDLPGSIDQLALILAVELSPNLGDGLRDQAAAVWDCEDAGLAATSIPSMNLTP